MTRPERSSRVDACLTIIHRSTASLEAPRLAVVLGSGLGSLAALLSNKTAISYEDLPGFPEPGVGGHAGRLVVGTCNGQSVALLQGRAHYYEGGHADAMAVALTTLKVLGCETLVLTNAAGSLRAEVGPGEVMLITDHINGVGVSPLFHETSDARFVDMVAAYDSGLRAELRTAAGSVGETLHEGTYLWLAGPQFETPAEIQAARVLGADAVGASTVPEVILARYLGLRVAALSNITNLAAGMSETALSHAHTQATAESGSAKIGRILERFFGSFGEGGC